MSTNYRRLRCSPQDVFDVLADAWLFPSWVVGASRMRSVDAAWPTPGSKLHHSFGVWPALLDDETTMLEWDPPRHAVMQPKGWPIGEALVTIDVKPRADGCLVRIKEKAVKGPGALLPASLLDPPLYARNVETLKRLGFLAEGRAGNHD
ncbi:polyketide cyclase/dehydrase/lipid transport protein [Glaciihabitans tibetensis]|uniref:Polyketide cyclase/dehydrase/lipid transport protein n=1 Tax=Glaciihabitans tibetensis TaxID=1266600 RepID=A0A2T0V4F3_9MICO|nr:SRPBCC family protein [Glaciihabitans tibetensis]PRY65055.1 polyketide cyclase/dehydrase/lipid transport protein [Glaciihabitans tibetensis]